MPMSDESPIVNPPWVYSPSEVEKWINASYPDHKVGKSKVERSHKPKTLKNIEIVLDLNIEKKEIPASNLVLAVLNRLTGKKIIEEQFELIPTAELFIRSLAQAKFHTMLQITIDGKTVYHEPENKQGLRDTIELLAELSHQQQTGNTITLKAIMDQRKTCIAEITIRKIHPKKEHSVTIRITGEIEEELFHRILNYLKKHLSVEIEEP